MLFTLWWFQISPQVPGWSTSVTKLYSLEAWGVFQEILWSTSGSHREIPEVSQCNGERFISRLIFILHVARIYSFLLLFRWICHLDLSWLKLIASCDGCHAWGRQRLLNLEQLVVLLAGPISHTSTQHIDFVNFLHFTGFVYHLFYSF